MFFFKITQKQLESGVKITPIYFFNILVPWIEQILQANSVCGPKHPDYIFIPDYFWIHRALICGYVAWLNLYTRVLGLDWEYVGTSDIWLEWSTEQTPGCGGFVIMQIRVLRFQEYSLDLQNNVAIRIDTRQKKTGTYRMSKIPVCTDIPVYWSSPNIHPLLGLPVVAVLGPRL